MNAKLSGIKDETIRRRAEQEAERRRNGSDPRPVADWGESLHTHPGMGGEEAESDEIQEEVRRHRKGLPTPTPTKDKEAA